LPSNPVPYQRLKCGERVTREQLEEMLLKIEPGVLLLKERDLIAFVVVMCEKAFAWEQVERGSFSREYFPDYVIPTIEHTPWQCPPIKIPYAILDEV
ncbi:hypothetical protein GYMLUDRAFT_146528, partial [Collybiopsis luxurians FD-317 M1]